MPPTISARFARISHFCPAAGEATTSPSTRTDAPVVACARASFFSSRSLANDELSNSTTFWPAFTTAPSASIQRIDVW